MSWPSRCMLRALACAGFLLIPLRESFAQWFVGDLKNAANHADYIIITSAENASAVQPLAAFRAARQPFSVITVLVDSITAGFPRATPDSSIRDFVTYALTRWQPPSPQFLLLAGNVNSVPSHRVRSPLQPYTGEDSVMIDQWLVNGPNDSQAYPAPAIAVGRFPAWTAGDLSTMISKTIAYEQTVPSAWAARSLAVADSGDGGIFEADAAEQQKHAAGVWHDTITAHVRPTSPAYIPRSKFLETWNQGCAAIDFVGHTNGWQFSHAAYFTLRDIDSLAVGSPLSLCITAGAQYFERPDSIPFAVALLQAPGRGASCVLAPSGLVYEASFVNFTNRIFDYLSQNPGAAIGRAWFSALQEQWNEIEFRRTLFGDPALIIKRSDVASMEFPGERKPSEYFLSQNYPNPFNPSTTIRYGLPHKSFVQLSVFNTLGQMVGTLVQGEMEAGNHEVKFEGTGLSSGVYIYRLQAGEYVATKKLLFLK